MSLERVLPGLVARFPARYAGLGLRGLADQMFDQLKTSEQTQAMSKAFSTLPTPAMTPASAYRELVHGNVESVSLDQLAGRTLATSVVPYPPGIPMLMPGELAGADDGPYLKYLRALRDWDRRFPGFGHDTHGVEVGEGGEQFIQCLRLR